MCGCRGSECVWVELGERRKPIEESLHAGRRECDEHRAITVADVLPGVRQPARDEHERARTGEAQLIAQLPADFAPQYVGDLVLPRMDMQRGSLAGRIYRFQRGECSVRLLASDDVGDVSAERAAAALPSPGRTARPSAELPPMASDLSQLFGERPRSQPPVSLASP